MKEQWKLIKETHSNQPIQYYVSNKGRFKRILLKTNTVIITKGSTYVRGKHGTYYYASNIGPMHRLVAQAFIPNPDNKPCVDHIDGNPSNNDVRNLRWTTYKENTNNPKTKIRYGKALAWRQVFKDGSFRVWESLHDIAKSYNIAHGTIWQAVKRNGFCRKTNSYWERISHL